MHFPDSVAYPLTLFVLMRIGLSIFALIIVVLSPINAPAFSSTDLSGLLAIASNASSLLLEPWRQWDTIWYLKIATLGYKADVLSVAFFPLYPLLIRAIGLILGSHFLLAALIISNLAALGSFVLLYQMTTRWFGQDTAQKTLLYLVAFPTAFFLFAGYAESLFLFLALLALRSALEGHWGQAGLFTALTALTRAPGIALVVPLIAEFTSQYRRGHAHMRDLALLLLLSGIGAGYWLFLLLAFGDLAIWFQSSSYWRIVGWPGQSIIMGIQALFSSSGFDWFSNLKDLLFTLFFIALILWGLSRLPRTLTCYSLAIIFPSLLSVYTLVPLQPLTSLPRHGILLFPVFISLASSRPHPRLQSIGITLALLLQVAFVALFVEGKWVA